MTTPSTAEIIARLRDRRSIFAVTDGHSFNTQSRDQLAALLDDAARALERLAWLPEPRHIWPSAAFVEGFNACLAEIEQHRSKP